jgi:hypothetical protein
LRQGNFRCNNAFLFVAALARCERFLSRCDNAREARGAPLAFADFALVSRRSSPFFKKGEAFSSVPPFDEQIEEGKARDNLSPL